MTEYVTVTSDAPLGRNGAIKLHGREAFAGMHKAGRLAAETLDMLVPHMVPGVTTAEIDRLIYDFVLAGGGVPATLGYRGYTHSTCISINHVVCHGVPSTQEVLREGDIANFDITLEKGGYIADSSKTYMIGDVTPAARRLVKTTYDALWQGIGVVRPGARLGDIGHAIESHARRAGYSVVRDYCGHGIGREMHEDPQVLHFGRPGTGLTLREGMVFTIEPMLNQGGRAVRTLDDGWTVVTADGRLSAQFEHT
ncbi:hypothetical protein LTR94_026406, partial [Friedmanniomyces endolithicus]